MALRAPRATSIFWVLSRTCGDDLTEIAGKDSSLHKKHKVYLDAVTVATPPENYEERLIPMFPGAWHAFGSLGWRLMIWLSPSWSGILIVIVMTCSNSHALAI